MADSAGFPYYPAGFFPAGYWPAGYWPGTVSATAKADSDSATTAEAGSLVVAVSAADAASGDDSGSIASAIAGSDAGSAAESATLVAALAGSDSSVGSDGQSVTVTGSNPADSDSGTAAEAWSIAVDLSSADSAALDASWTLAADLTASDSGSAAEAATGLLAALAGTDSGGSTESGTTSADATAPSDSDSAIAAESGSIVVELSAADAGGVRETTSLSGNVRRDDDGYAEIVSLLEATGEFDEVIFGASPDRDRRTAQQGRVVAITPGRRARTLPQPSPGRLLREARYTLTITVADRTVADSRAELDRLFAVCHNTLDRVSLGGWTLFDKSVLEADDYDDRWNPAGRLTASGQFAYVVPVSPGFRTSA